MGMVRLRVRHRSARLTEVVSDSQDRTGFAVGTEITVGCPAWRIFMRVNNSQMASLGPKLAGRGASACTCIQHGTHLLRLCSTWVHQHVLGRVRLDAAGLAAEAQLLPLTVLAASQVLVHDVVIAARPAQPAHVPALFLQVFTHHVVRGALQCGHLHVTAVRHRNLLQRTPKMRCCEQRIERWNSDPPTTSKAPSLTGHLTDAGAGHMHGATLQGLTANRASTCCSMLMSS